MTVEVLAHRGWWESRAEHNSIAALSRALIAGHGIETDLRDRGSAVVVSHDMATPASPQLSELLERYKEAGWQGMLALNVKADGLVDEIERLLRVYGIDRYFLFDMSIPDTLPYLARGLHVYTRRSEFEKRSALDVRSAGVWLDAFEAPFVSDNDLRDALESANSVALVSPELHRKDHLKAWALWKSTIASHVAGEGKPIMICTDFPEEAASFFCR